MNRSTGVVIIGRNEGERLKRCFESVLATAVNIIGTSNNIVYVDSGSTDNSVSIARQMGIPVVELDMSKPFSAARGRNAGFDHLIAFNPEVDHVQFIDGDCQMIEGYFKKAVEFLDSQQSYAIVCGRLREQYPEKSIYNRLCDIEWDGTAGDIDSCGGIFMTRAKAYKEVGGMNPAIVAGEESDMCIRLRLRNWKIYRIDHDMAWHDAGMTKFSQWWKRAKRTGYAYALGASIHGKTRFRHFVQQKRSSLLHGLAIPVSIAAASLIFDLRLLLLFGFYPLQILRVYMHLNRQNMNHVDSLLFAANCIIAKFPQLAGIMKFYYNQILKRENRIIEYK